MKKVAFLSMCLIIIFVLSGISSAAEKIFYYHTDQAGTPLAMTDESGTVVWKADYKPFGEEQSINPATIENNERFIGKEKDKETGHYYFGARYMLDKIGRFISPDPVGPIDPMTGQINQKMLMNPQMLNPYAYAGNNPYRYIDPMGLSWEYSQTTGQLTHVDDQTGERNSVATGYSGHDAGLNNPDMQDLPNVGPIPQGTWTIGPQQDNTTGRGHSLPASMRLTPENETYTFDRAGFLIHGDNGRGDQSASEGCIILNRNVRNEIGNSGDNELRVIP